MPQLNITRYAETIDLDFSLKRLGYIAAVGFGAGILTWLLSLLLQVVIVEPVFCRSADSFGACANGGTIAAVTSIILVSILAVAVLVKLKVYRPLLVVLAVVATLYGTHGWLGQLSWYEASLWNGSLFGFAYALYTWVARLRSFAVVVGAMLLCIVVARLLMAQL